MDISSSIHRTHTPQNSDLSQHGLSRSVIQAEDARVPAANQTDSFILSDKARAVHSNQSSLEPFEDQEKQIIGEKAPESEQSVTGKQSLADDEAVTDKEPSIDNKSSSNGELSEDELLEVEELKRRDTEVRAHEQAHMSAAGNLAQGGANFSFETGPDGKRYAVGGDVSIDTSPIAGDPLATLRKAQQIQRAASAPVDPSSQDRSVAAQASRMEAQARVEISQQAREKQTEYIDDNTTEIDFFGPENDRNEQSIHDTYQKIQNSSVLQEQRSFIDFFV